MGPGSAPIRRDLACWDVDSREPGSRPGQLVFRERVAVLVPQLEQLLQAARARGSVVVSTICIRRELQAADLPPDALYVDTEPAADDGELDRAAAASQNIVVHRESCGSSVQNIRHRAFDVFHANPNATRIVRAVGADRWVVFGDSLGYCLRSTVEGLLRHGQAVTVVKDVAGQGIDTPARAREILAELERAGATLERADAVLARLG